MRLDRVEERDLWNNAQRILDTRKKLGGNADEVLDTTHKTSSDHFSRGELPIFQKGE